MDLTEVAQALGRIEQKVDDLGDKLDSHLVAHEAAHARRNTWWQTVLTAIACSGVFVTIVEWLRGLTKRA